MWVWVWGSSTSTWRTLTATWSCTSTCWWVCEACVLSSWVGVGVGMGRQHQHLAHLDGYLEMYKYLLVGV